MKKFLLCLILSAFFISGVKAAPGDTTWVQAHSGVWLDWYGNFDSTVTFPDGSASYRKIYMYFTLGKYVCPGSPQYCSDWDYTVQTMVMTPGGDTLELGRFITPYAKGTRMPANWTGVYKFDVTDYYPLLRNSATVRVHYSGYSGGFTADVKFAFIEGTPPRDVVGITRVWKGGYNYGHGSVAINDALDNVSLTAPANAVSAEAKFTITGHGGDDQGCAEFCQNTYTLNLNNSQLVQQNFWRNDCGFNHLYPQSGTWVFDRAGWCPGDLIRPYSHVLTGVTANSNFTLNATFPAYTSTTVNGGSPASYIIENNVVYYAGFNHTLDASLEEILTPTNDETFFRLNPNGSKPVIRVRNTGSTTISSIQFEYGVTATSWRPTHTWNGTIAPLEEMEITLPEPWGLRLATGNNNQFFVKILEVNGQQDEDQTNNELTSLFDGVPVWNTKLRISLKTNGSTVNGVSETSWRILDDQGNVVTQRSNAAPNTTYEDTITLGPSLYKLEVSDAGCDGVSWWLYPSYPQNPGTGQIMVRNLSSALPLPLKGYFGGDFGCGFSQWFRTDWPTSVNNLSAQVASVEAYPNPAQNTVTVNISGIDKIDGYLQIIDATGRTVITHKVDHPSQVMDIASLANGLYSVIYTDAQGKLQTRLLIAH